MLEVVQTSIFIQASILKLKPIMTLYSLAVLHSLWPFSGSTVNPTKDYITGQTTLYGHAAILTHKLPVGAHLAEHNSKVGPAISSCLRWERGFHMNQLCPAIRLKQGPPCCPARHRYMERQGDNRSHTVSSFIRLSVKGHYFENIFFLFVAFDHMRTQVPKLSNHTSLG